MQFIEASAYSAYDSDSPTSDGSWPETIPSSPSSTRDQVDGSHWLPVTEKRSYEIHTSDPEPTIHSAGAGHIHTPDEVSIVSLRKVEPRSAHDSSIPSGSSSDESADDSMMNRRRPIPRRASWENNYFCGGNKYTQNGAKRGPDHPKSLNGNQATCEEGTASYPRTSDCQRSAQPVTLVESSPTSCGRSSSDVSYVSCTEYASRQEEATTERATCTSSSSSRRRTSRLATFHASQLAAIHARVEERMREVRNAHASSIATPLAGTAFADTTSMDTDLSLQEQDVHSASNDESYHQYTDSTPGLSQKSSVYSRSMAWGKTMLTKATGRRKGDGDAVERPSDSASNRTQSRTASRSRKLTNLTGLSSVRRFVWSKWHNRGKHRPTILTRTYNV